MAHIHELYDFVVSAFIVHFFPTPKVLLIYHKKYNEWLPIGGHIELNEDPWKALHREIHEECALKVRILSKAPAIRHPGVKPIPAPPYVDTHRISRKHWHIAFVYFGVSKSSKVRLHHAEHRAFKWVAASDLSNPKWALTRSIKFYCREALKAASAAIVLMGFMTGLAMGAPLDTVYLKSTGDNSWHWKVEQKQWLPAVAQSPIRIGDSLRTASGQSAEIALKAEGQSGLIRLEPETTLRRDSSKGFRLVRGAIVVLQEPDPSALAAPRELAPLQFQTADLSCEAGIAGFALDTRHRGTLIKVFSDQVSVSGVVVGEGFKFYRSAEPKRDTPHLLGWTRRLSYADYNEWRKWIRKVYKERDDETWPF